MTLTTITKKTGRWALPILLALLIGFAAFTLPVQAAVDGTGTGGDTEASVSFTAGELRLMSAPALDFGIHDISNIEQEFAAESTGPNVQVSDLRGSGAGWDLMVSLSPFRLEEGGGPTLQAATITTTSPTVHAVNGNVGAPPAQPTQIVLTSDDNQTLAWQAGKDTGMGVWDLEWHEANTKLKVQPGTAQKGKSVATLTWSLQSTP